MDSRRIMIEAFLGEATFEVPDAELSAFQRVISGAIRRRVLPLAAKDWIATNPSRTRRASDRLAKGTTPPPVAAPPAAPPPAQDDDDGGPVVSKRTGRATPATNRFVKASRPAPEPADDFDAEDPTDPGVAAPKPRNQGRDGDAEPFPDFGPPPSASFDATDSTDDRVLSHGFLGKSDDDDDVQVPDPEGGHGMRRLSGRDDPRARTAARRAGSISGMFRPRQRDGRAELDRALKSADKGAQRAAKHGSKKQGFLSRLMRGRDVTR